MNLTALKPGFHITVMAPTVRSQAEYEMRLVPGTAGRVQSCLRYRQYRTVREKQSHEVEFFVVTLSFKTAAGKQETNNFCQFFVLGYRRLNQRRNQVEYKHKFWISEIFRQRP